MEFLEFIERFATRAVLNTIALVIVLAVARHLVERYVHRRTRSDPRNQRRWISTVRNFTVAILLVGLLFIWSPQLTSLALSLTAVAVAIVIATKEIILNLSGAVMKMATGPFEIGDWIEVDGARGEVISENLFAVKLLELDEGAGLSRFTGRTLTVPNSKFLTATVVNEGSLRQYTFHRFTVHVDPASNAFAKRDDIIAIAERHTQPFRADGERLIGVAQGDDAPHLPAGQTLVRVRTGNVGATAIEVTIFCPIERTVELEQTIAHEIIELVGVPQAEAE